MSTKIAFISYSWDDENHKEWVLDLANNLVENGIDVIFDQYDLSAGHEMTYFMEKAMTSDKVVVILTPNYKLKADKREGGVGYEYSLLTKEYYDKESDKTRIIPVLRIGDDKISCPTYMQTRLYHDMRDEGKFDAKFFELVKLISDKPLVKKPPLGQLPNFDESIPDLDKTITDYQKKEDFVHKKNAIIRSEKGVEIFVGESRKIVKQISDALESYKNNFRLYFHIKTFYNPPSILFTTVNFTSVFQSDYQYNNDASAAHLILKFFKGPVGFNDMMFDYSGPRESVYAYTLDFDLDEGLNPIFIKRDNKNIKFTSHDIATIAVRDVIANEIKFRENQLK